MARLDWLQSGSSAQRSHQRIYLDSNIWIYALEPVSDYGELIADLFDAADAGLLTLVTSELALAEILVRPIKQANTFE